MKLFVPFLFQCFSHSPSTHEYLGSCKYWNENEQKPYVISINQNLNVSGDERLMSFEFFNDSCERASIQGEEKIDFIRSYIWPWSEVDVQILKYRNGKKGTGMMHWNRVYGEGYLRKANKDKYFYVNLYDCNIDITNLDFSKSL